MKKLRKEVIVFGFMLAFAVAGCSKQTNETARNDSGKEITAASNKGTLLKVSPSESKLAWTGKKVTGQHNGLVDLKSGELFVENGILTGGKFEVDFTTIRNLDIKDEESSKKLDGHLKSEDFFSAEKFPVGTFEITRIQPTSDQKGNNYQISGNMTIKGITKEVSFPAKVNVSNGSVSADADITMDRTLWDIKFRSGKFFENLGDNLINDDFNLKLQLIAN